MYTHMSTEVGVKQGVVEAKDKLQGNYIEIPLNVKYKITTPVANIIKPYVFTGPTLAMKLGGDDDYFQTKTCQWGWNLGIGVELIDHLQIGAGYTWGMNNIADKLKINDLISINTADIKVKNNYWTITAAWLF